MLPEKKNCFYIIPRIPFPAVGGDRLKYFNSIKVLSARFNLHVIIISDAPLSKAAEEFLAGYTASYKFFYFRKLAFLLNVVKGVFGKNPLQVSYYYFKKVNDYCASVIKPDDIVIANLIRTAPYAFSLPNKKILNLEDSIYQNYSASIKRVSSLVWKLIYRVELTRLKYFEEKCIKAFNLSTFVNEAEQQYYNNIGNTVWLPNGVADGLCQREFTVEGALANEVAFLGKMDYQPNVDAVVWFANNVIATYPHIKLTIIGAKPNKRVLALKEKYKANITVTGYVDDPFAIMKSAVAVVAPMQTGAGLQNKILEAMAAGCVVLASPLGAGPIKYAVNAQHLFTCNSAADYVELVDVLMKNNAYRTTIGLQARQLIKQHYTWPIYGQRLFALIDGLAN